MSNTKRPQVMAGKLLPSHRFSGVPLVADTTPGDTLRGLIAAGTSPRPTDCAIVQIAARPASRRQVRRARKAADTNNAHPTLSGLLDVLDPTASNQRQGARTLESPWVGAQRKELQERLTHGDVWTVSIRYAVTTPKAGESVSRLHGVGAAVVAMLSAVWHRRRLHHPHRVFNQWKPPGRHGVLMSAEELARLVHLPADEIVPAIDRAGARPVAPSPAITGGGRSTKTLGVSDVTGHKVALAATDARYHSHIVGPTGSGKSTLLLNLILSDIRDRRGLVLIDPRGDLVNDILDRLKPDTVAGRVVLIDPAQPGTPPGLPPIPDTTDSDVAIDHLVGICRNIFAQHWGPRADDILRQALRTQARFASRDFAGLSALPILLTDKSKRARITADLTDPVLNGFWTWFDALPAGVQTQAVGPVLARLRAILGRDYVRQTIGDPAPQYAFNLTRALDKGGIVLARLPKGQLGEDTAKFLGSILVARTWQTITQRQTQPEEARKDCSLYIDEAQNFLNLPQSVEDMLAEARALRLSITLAHQHMAQLDRDLQAAASANCRTKIYFTTSPEDAKVLARHTLPNLTEHDLAHLGAYTAACRTLTSGQIQPAFTMTTLPAIEPHGDAATIRHHTATYPAYTTR